MDSERIRYLDVLRIRNFSLLWVGQVISNFGDRFNYMAVMGLILFMMQGSAMDAGIMFICWSLPAIVFGPIAGVFVDRYNKKNVMIICDVLRAVLVIFIPFATSLLQIYVLIFLVSSVSRFFFPARSAIIPSLVASDYLLVANSLSQSTYQISAIMGYAIGGMIVGFFGPELVFMLDSISYIVSAIMIYNIGYIPTEKIIKKIEAGQLKKVFVELVEGLRFSYNERRILYIFSTFTGALLFFGGINILWIMMIRDVLGLGVEGMGILESVFGGGMLLGTFLVGYMGHKYRYKQLMLTGFFFVSFSFLAIGLWMQLLNILLFASLAGIFMSFINIPIVTLLQRITPKEMLGRIFGVLGTLTELAAIISMAAIGILADIYAVDLLLIALSLGLLLISVLASIVNVDIEPRDECIVA